MHISLSEFSSWVLLMTTHIVHPEDGLKDCIFPTKHERQGRGETGKGEKVGDLGCWVEETEQDKAEEVERDKAEGVRRQWRRTQRHYRRGTEAAEGGAEPA